MKKWLKYSAVVTGLSLLPACVSLDKDSDFTTQAVRKVEEQSNYIEITSKEYAAEKIDASGNTPIETLVYTKYFRFKKNQYGQNPSAIYLETSYFNNHPTYIKTLLNGKPMDFTPTKPSKANCKEIDCTVTQYLTIPVSVEDIQRFAEEGLTIKLLSPSPKTYIEYSVNNAYYSAITEQMERRLNPEIMNNIQATDESSSPVEIVQYWFKNISEEEQEAYTAWAVKNRKAKSPSPLIGSDALKEMSLIFIDAAPFQKTDILNWLMLQ